MQSCTDLAGRAPDALMGPWLEHKPMLIGICMRWTEGNAADAEDLLSDACVKALEATRLGSTPVANPVALWITIIGNLGRDRRRRSSRRHDAVGPARVAMSVVPAAMTRPDEAVSSKQQLVEALRALTELPHEQRLALALRSVGGDYGEIAGRLDISSGNARKLVQLARGLLRVAIRNERPAHKPNSARALRKTGRAQRTGLVHGSIFS